MTWSTINKNNARVRIGSEGTFGTTSSNMLDLVVDMATDPLAKQATKMLPDKDVRRRRREAVAPVRGLQAESPVELALMLKRLANFIGSGSSPVAFSNASALSHQLVHRAMWGYELAPQGGTAVVSSSGSPVTSITITTGHDTRFALGQWIGIMTDAGLEPRRVVGITAGPPAVLTVWPALDGTPVVDTDSVHNGLNYCLPEAMDTSTFTVDRAFVETSTAETQKRSRGTYFDSASFDLKVGEVPTIKLGGKSIGHDGPGNLSLVTTPTSDDMGAPLVFDPHCYFDSTIVGKPSLAEVSEVSFKLTKKWQSVVGPGVNGTIRVVEVAGRDSPLEVTVKYHQGLAEYTAYNAGTLRHLILWWRDGSGSLARVAGLHFPRLLVVEEPQEEAVGELVFVTAKCHAMLDTTLSGANPALNLPEIEVSPAHFFLI